MSWLGGDPWEQLVPPSVGAYRKASSGWLFYFSIQPSAFRSTRATSAACRYPERRVVFVVGSARPRGTGCQIHPVKQQVSLLTSPNILFSAFCVLVWLVIALPSSWFKVPSRFPFNIELWLVWSRLVFPPLSLRWDYDTLWDKQLFSPDIHSCKMAGTYCSLVSYFTPGWRAVTVKASDPFTWIETGELTLRASVRGTSSRPCLPPPPSRLDTDLLMSD